MKCPKYQRNIIISGVNTFVYLKFILRKDPKIPQYFILLGQAHKKKCENINQYML